MCLLVKLNGGQAFDGVSFPFLTPIFSQFFSPDALGSISNPLAGVQRLFGSPMTEEKPEQKVLAVKLVQLNAASPERNLSASL